MLKLCKKIAISSKYYIIKFINHFKLFGKDLEKFALLLRKSVMCYESIDSWGKLEEKLLPPKEKLFSKLNNKSISDNNFKHAQWVGNSFNNTNIGVNQELYNMQGVCSSLAMDIDFIKSTRGKCNLNLLHFVTLSIVFMRMGIKNN